VGIVLTILTIVSVSPFSQAPSWRHHSSKLNLDQSTACETILYSQEPQGDGCFEEDEREYFLMKAKKAIVKKFNEMEG
ncbi:hypothetical protein Q4249_08370, partial [Acinetobacter baumannii]